MPKVTLNRPMIVQLSAKYIPLLFPAGKLLSCENGIKKIIMNLRLKGDFKFVSEKNLLRKHKM